MTWIFIWMSIQYKVYPTIDRRQEFWIFCYLESSLSRTFFLIPWQFEIACVHCTLNVSSRILNWRQVTVNCYYCLLSSCHFIYNAWKTYRYSGIFGTSSEIYDGSFLQKEWLLLAFLTIFTKSLRKLGTHVWHGSKYISELCK